MKTTMRTNKQRRSGFHTLFFLIAVFMLSAVSTLAIVTEFKDEGGFSSQTSTANELNGARIDVNPNETINIVAMNITLTGQIDLTADRLIVWSDANNLAACNISMTSSIAVCDLPAAHENQSTYYISWADPYSTFTKAFQAGGFPQGDIYLTLQGGSEWNTATYANSKEGINQSLSGSFQRGLLNISWENGTAGAAAPPSYAAPTISIVSPLENDFFNSNSVSINITASVDPALAVKNISYFINGTFNTSVASIQNTILTLGDGLYNINVTIYDNTSNQASDSVNTFKTDTINPSDNLLAQLPAGSIFGEDVNITVTASNTNLFGHNISIYRDSDGALVYSSENLNISSPTNAVTIPIDVSAFGAGSYTAFSNESDDHTINSIGEYDISHDLINNIMHISTGSTEVLLSLTDFYAQNPAGQRIPTQAVMQSMGHTKKTDRYEFEFNLEPIATAHRYVYVIEIISQDTIIYRKDSGYKGHFVIADNWLDFEGDHDVFVEQTGANSYTVTVVSASNSPQFRSIGGTNQGGTTTTFTITDPVIVATLCDGSQTLAACNSFDTATTDFIDIIQTQCTDTNSSSVNLLQAGVIVATGSQTTGTGVGNDFYVMVLNQSVTMQDSILYAVNSSCANGVSTQYAYTSWTPSTAPTPSGQTLAGFNYNAVATMVVSGIIFAFLFGFILSRFKRK